MDEPLMEAEGHLQRWAGAAGPKARWERPGAVRAAPGRPGPGESGRSPTSEAPALPGLQVIADAK